MVCMRALLCVSVVSLAIGCGGAISGPPRASVSGRLTIGGVAVEGVQVHFVNPEFPEHGSYAVTKAGGEFKLVQGAVPGTNTVFFSKIEGEGLVTDPEGGMDAGQFEAMAASGNGEAGDIGPKQLVPAEYSSSNSKLTFSVPAGGTSAAIFDL